jgi:leucyl-tRNA synthetase
MSKYDPKEIEPKWQKKWLEEKVFRADDGSKKPKYYQLETFPYPSGEGLHVGPPKGYIAEDIRARYMRMHGREVLYTMGWDAFGLPTENYAIKVKKSPKVVAKENTDNFRRQVRMFGLSYDWGREINTSSPEYYRWTQWLFIRLFRKGLAYRAMAKVNWCPKDQTVLANEQVTDGKCDRCGSVIEERDMEQWFFRITKYAEELLSGLKGLDWPAATVKRQEDWIGKSEGVSLKFPIADSDLSIEVFTTRPDTLFGATYMVLAPEHPLVERLRPKITNWSEVQKYAEAARHKTDRMREVAVKEKTGVELKGIKAVNPATKGEIPVWIADYVLGSYGTGAIMAVPAHDERDFEFAKKSKLPIRKVVKPFPLRVTPETAAATGIAHGDLRVESDCFIGAGELVNSGKFDGMDSEKAKKEIVKFVGGTAKTQYKLHDWSVSRQRYWGVPIPMIHCEKCGIVPVSEKDLPVLLPDLENYRPKGLPPLASSKGFMEVKCPKCRGAATRDPETLDTFVDSSWYYLRYADPHNAEEIFDKKEAKHWLPVDLYVIGAEHTVLHLLYSRFITKFLRDEGWLSFGEPFLMLRHQGLILGEDGHKMSKSKGNVVNPDELIAKFGADTVRMYEMFMGPFEDGAPWDPKSILGVNRFLVRVWKYGERSIADLTKENGATDAGTGNSLLHRTIKKVGEDIEQFKFNTAISALMILLNGLEEGAALSKTEFGAFVKILHPFAPHLAQELWARLGNAGYLDFEPWPAYAPALVQEAQVALVVQVNGRVRATLTAGAAIAEEEAKKLALGDQKVQTALGGKAPKKVIYVGKPDKKLVNIVT